MPRKMTSSRTQVPRKATQTPAKGSLTEVAMTSAQQKMESSQSRPSKPKPSTRRNKKGLVLYVDPEVSIALRRLSLDTQISVQNLGMTALNLLFERHGQETFPLQSEAGP